MAGQAREGPAPPLQHMRVKGMLGIGLKQGFVLPRGGGGVAGREQAVGQAQLGATGLRGIREAAHERGDLGVPPRARGGVGEERKTKREPRAPHQVGMPGAPDGVRGEAHGLVRRAGGEGGVRKRTRRQHIRALRRVGAARDQPLEKTAPLRRLARARQQVGGEEARGVSRRSRHLHRPLALQHGPRGGGIAEAVQRLRPLDGVLRVRDRVGGERGGGLREEGEGGGAVVRLRCGPRREAQRQRGVARGFERRREGVARVVRPSARELRPRAPVAEPVARRVGPRAEPRQHVRRAPLAGQGLQLHEARGSPHRRVRRRVCGLGRAARGDGPQFVAQGAPGGGKGIRRRERRRGAPQDGEDEKALHCSAPR